MECLFWTVQQILPIKMSADEKVRLFCASAVWFPVLDESKLRDILNQGWSDEKVGTAVRHLLMPVHVSCVPNQDLWMKPPKYTTWHNKLGPWACAKELVWAKDLSEADIIKLKQINKVEARIKISLRQAEKYLPYAGANGMELEQYTVHF